MQIAGSSFANLPDGHRCVQQSQCVPRGGSQVSHPMGGSGDVEDTSGNLKERLFIKPPSVGERTGEPGRKSPPCRKGIVQSDQSSNAESQVTHSKMPLKMS